MLNIIHGNYLEKKLSLKTNLLITSPPYGIGKEYETRKTYNQYYNFTKNWFSKSIKETSEDAVLCVQSGFIIIDKKPFPIDYILTNIALNYGLKLNNRIVWHFGHGSHCKNRLSGRYETVCVFSKNEKHTFNLDEVRVPQKYPNKKHYKGKNKGKLSGNPLGKNPSDVWEITNVKHNHPEKTEHPCQFPELLVERLVKLYSNKNDIVLDPFVGSGTTAKVCKVLNRNFIGFDKEKKYIDIAVNRLKFDTTINN